MSNFVNLLDIVYPVGSVYITFSDISPVDSVGGSWEKIDGKFLQSSSDNNKVDSTGGSSDVIGFYISYVAYYSGLCTNDNAHSDNVIALGKSDHINDYNKDYITYKRHSEQSIWNHLCNNGVSASRKSVPKPSLQTVSARWDNRPAYITCNMYRRIA